MQPDIIHDKQCAFCRRFGRSSRPIPVLGNRERFGLPSNSGLTRSKFHSAGICFFDPRRLAIRDACSAEASTWGLDEAAISGGSSTQRLLDHATPPITV